MPPRGRPKGIAKKTHRILKPLCFGCGTSLDLEDATDVYGDSGVFKCHFRCAGPAQDLLDEEFNAREEEEEEEKEN